MLKLFYKPISLKSIVLTRCVLILIAMLVFGKLHAQQSGIKDNKQRYFTLMLLNISQEKDFHPQIKHGETS